MLTTMMMTTKLRYGSYLMTVMALLLLSGGQMALAQQNDEQMASYYYQHGEFDKAIELYEPLYNKTQNVYYYQMLYKAYCETERLKDAEKLVEKRLKRNPKELALYVDLGELQLRQGEKKKAEKSFAAALEKVSYDVKTVNDLALAFDKANHTDYAVRTYLTARERTQNPYAYVMELATLYQKQGDYEKMTAEYFGLIDQQPTQINNVKLALQRALNETSNPKLADGLRKTLAARIRQNPNNKQNLDMMIWFSLQQKDFRFALTQAKAIDARFPDEGAESVLRVAQIAQNNEDYEVAAEAYNYLIAKGKDGNYYYDSRVGALMVKQALVNRNHALPQKELHSLENEYEQTIAELGKTQQTVPLMRNYAHLLAYYDTQVQKAADLLYDIIELPRLSNNTISEVKLELGDLLLFSGEIWDASLLYSQVEKANKNEVIGAQAKYKNALLSYYNNDFDWAKSQLDVLRASTSKLVANDAMQLSLIISDNMEEDSTYDMLSLYAAGDLYLYRNQLDSAWAMYDAVNQRSLSHALFDEILMQKAKIRLKQGRYNEADSLLQRVVDHYSEDILADDALWMLAELNEGALNNAAKARDCYEKLILDYPASLYVDRARKRLAVLRNKEKND